MPREYHTNISRFHADRNCAPELLAFGAYDADQLKTIIINQVEDSLVGTYLFVRSS
jgi:Cdc6-like AAA superfamily ATPase